MRHPFIQRTRAGDFTMSQDLCQVGYWLIRRKQHDPRMGPRLGHLENHELFVMPETEEALEREDRTRS